MTGPGMWEARSDGLWWRGNIRGPSWTVTGSAPDVPTINYSDLYVSGDTVSQALNRLTTYRQVILPDGFDEDFQGFPDASNTYGIYAPRVIGLRGSSPAQARLRLAPNSSTATQRARITTADNPLTCLRFMSNNPSGSGYTSTGYPSVYYGFTLEGTDQAVMSVTENRPHSYAGLINFMGSPGSWYENIKILGIPGYSNYPPGETFALNSYRDQGTMYRNIDSSGLNALGHKVGGSPFGANGSKDLVIEDSYFHDCWSSSLTFSTAGPSGSGLRTENITTRRVRVAHNANQSAAHRFGGVNHENIAGTITHYDMDIQIDGATTFWDTAHMSFVNVQTSNSPVIRIIEPVWHESPVQTNGCFVVEAHALYVDGTPSTINPATDITVIKNGIPLTPYIFNTAGGAYPTSPLPVNPTQHFVVWR